MIDAIHSCGIPCSSLLVSNSHLTQKIEHCIHTYLPQLPIKNQKGSSLFDFIRIRDLRVVLWDGTHLIPQPLPPSIQSELLAILPPSAYHLDSAVIGLFNEERKGYSQDVEMTKKNAEDLHIPYRVSLCAVHGSNCHLFLSKEGKKMAAIGILSLLGSYLTLRETGFLETNLTAIERIKNAIEEPSDDSIRAMKLLSKEIVDLKTLEILRKEPLTDADKQLYEKEALYFEASLKLTQKLIAKELGVLPDNLIVLLQEDSHLNNHFFVTGDGVLFYHDETKAQELLLDEDIHTLIQGKTENDPLPNYDTLSDITDGTIYMETPQSQKLTYLRESSEKKRINQEVLQENSRLLREKNLTLHPIAGVFTYAEGHAISFMNNLPLSTQEKHHLFVFSSQDETLSTYFKRNVELLSQTEVCLIESPSTGAMLREGFEGGLHTFTTLL